MVPVQDGIHKLVDDCLAGDQAAMRALVDRFRDQVFRLCFRMLGQRQDAEDAAQETFVRMLKSLSRWDASRDFEPWLLAIAGNRCRSALAARQRRPAMGTLADDPPATSTGFEAARHLAEEVQVALGQVRPDYREAFLLFHEHELSYEEVAVALDRPLGTIKTWIHRARHELIASLRKREVLQEPRHAVRRV
jgi:RNA polymerase sigma-70 factor (ECF subfamily)